MPDSVSPRWQWDTDPAAGLAEQPLGSWDSMGLIGGAVGIRGRLFVYPGLARFHISGLSGFGRKQRDFDRAATEIEIFVHKLRPPWQSVTVPISAEVSASVGLLAKRGLVRSLEQAGFTVTVRRVWHANWLTVRRSAEGGAPGAG